MPFREDADALRERNAELERVHSRQHLELEIMRRQNAQLASLRARGAALDGEREQLHRRRRHARRAAAVGVVIASTALMLALGLAYSEHEDASVRAALLAQSAAQLRARDAALDDARHALADRLRATTPIGRAHTGALVRARVTASAPGSLLEPADTCMLAVAFDEPGDPCTAALRCFAHGDVRLAVTCDLDADGALRRVRSIDDTAFPTVALDLSDATLAIRWRPDRDPTRAVVAVVTPFAMP